MIRRVTILFGVLGVVGYISADDLGATNFVHRWELFHYYLGSKYPKELGYKRIYLCAAIAQSEMSPAMREEVVARRIRDLETDVIREAAPSSTTPRSARTTSPRALGRPSSRTSTGSGRPRTRSSGRACPRTTGTTRHPSGP